MRSASASHCIMSSTQSSKHAVVVATALATVTLALWMYRRQRRQQPCGAAEEIPAAECAQHAGQKGAEKQQSSVQLPPLPMPSRPVCIIYDGSADSSRAVANILEEQLGTGFDCASSELANLPTDALRVGGAFLFVVECDKEGEATAARPFTRALRPLRMADSQALDGASVGVLALAHSVCAYSAASGGSDKFRGGARLLSSLTEAGARPLHALGMAEMEVRVCRATTPRRACSAPTFCCAYPHAWCERMCAQVEEVEVSVVPWAVAVRAALERDAQAEQAVEGIVRAAEAQLRARP